MRTPRGPHLRAVEQSRRGNNRLKASYLSASDKRAMKMAREKREAERRAADERRMQELLEQARSEGAAEFEAEMQRIRDLGAQVQATIEASRRFGQGDGDTNQNPERLGN